MFKPFLPILFLTLTLSCRHACSLAGRDLVPALAVLDLSACFELTSSRQTASLFSSVAYTKVPLFQPALPTLIFVSEP